MDEVQQYTIAGAVRSQNRMSSQERIMSEPFGEEGEVFSYSLFLVLANRILTFCVAATFLWVSLYAPQPVF